MRRVSSSHPHSRILWTKAYIVNRVRVSPPKLQCTFEAISIKRQTDNKKKANDKWKNESLVILGYNQDEFLKRDPSILESIVRNTYEGFEPACKTLDPISTDGIITSNHHDLPPSPPLSLSLSLSLSYCSPPIQMLSNRQRFRLLSETCALVSRVFARASRRKLFYCAALSSV